MAVLAAAGAAVALVERDDGGADRPCDAAPVTLRATIDAAVSWLTRAAQPDGRFWYEYDRSRDELSPAYNVVRHAGTTMSLYQVAAAGDPLALDTADAGLRYILDGLVQNGDHSAFVGPDRTATLGATALTVAALAHRRLTTGDEQHDPILRSMGRFMQALMRDDGGMWAEATVPDLEPIVGVTSTFFTGEAFWALGLLANQFPGEGWDQSARAVGHYLATERDLEEEVEHPPLPDQWAAYGFAEMRQWGPLRDPELAYVRSLVGQYHDRLDRELGREAQRVSDGTGAPDESVDQSRGAAFGTTVEALASLWRLSTVDPGMSDLAPGLQADLLCGASILAARQYSAERAAAWPQPEVVEGAWFDDDVTRVDDQQHAMSGVLLALDASTAGAEG